MAKRGRPTKFTAELAKRICDDLAAGRSLRAICRDEDMPSEMTVRDWSIRDVSGFSSQYEDARAKGYDAMAEEILEIADDGSNDTYLDDKGKTRVDFDVVQRSRLRVDTRKWLLSKMLPKRYGEVQRLEHTGPGGNPLNVSIIGRPTDD